MAYVDGFIVPVPKKNIQKYRKIATKFGKIWRKLGALDYMECMAEDVSWGKRTSFPRSVKLKSNEVVFFSWITYKSKADRNRINKKIMNDPALTAMMGDCPFDAKRMIYGGFKPVVSL